MTKRPRGPIRNCVEKVGEIERSLTAKDTKRTQFEHEWDSTIKLGFASSSITQRVAILPVSQHLAPGHELRNLVG